MPAPPPAPDPPERALVDLAQQLDAARSRIEERFLEGSRLLGAALDSTAAMRTLLETVLAALDADAVAATSADLAATVRRLQDLPGRQAAQHRQMAALATLGRALQSHVGDMQDTLRYLRTVAVTVKIAGADAAEFGEFANGMLDRIQAGRLQVDGFAARLGLLLGQAQVAAALHRDLQAQYARSLPDLTRDLERNSLAMQDYHAGLRRIAASQEDVVRDIEGQVARILSALQIGDMTRQRVEHVQGGLLLLGEAAPRLAPGGQAPVRDLLAAQLSDLTQEFHAGGATVTASLARLAAAMARMPALGRQAGGGDGGGSGDGGDDAFLPAMERSLLSARAIVTRIEAAGDRTAEVGRTAAAIAHELTAAVGAIATIRAEIQLMAINTSLRCRRLGDAGRAIVVVAAELRSFAARLEEVAGRLLADLGRVGALLPDLPADPDVEAPLGAALDLVLETIHASHRQMRHDLQLLAARGEDLAGDLGHGIARLDFARDLGDALDTALAGLTPGAGAGQPVKADTAPAPAAGALLARIRASYTMARERELHDALLGTGAGTAAAAAATTGPDACMAMAAPAAPAAAMARNLPAGAPPPPDPRASGSRRPDMEEDDSLAAIFF